ncbi:FecR family protein [Mucilaginibacter sp. AW1-7]|uniref:FecR family protein n=1 Tax=unclassified Mucilaginibacter TaxID=2617802 RepID=UPI0023663A10|nr:FecR family protein [Mucilaginibacter sp. KACC 22773]WDF80589.1 FecR family protein [Mucilaginibacter sp. KACC 22773]
MVNERFIELLTKKLSDEMNAAELEEFNFLLANDEACRQQNTFFKTYWIKNEELYSNTNLMFQRIVSKIEVPATEIQQQNSEATGERFKTRRMIIFLRSLAALLIIGIGLSATYYLKAYNQKSFALADFQQKKTSSRVKSKIYLSDGTVVTLNSETTLKYPSSFTGPTREVYLNGEAFFDVAKDHQHPFIVHAGKMSIRVVGTAFNVKSYKNDIASETTLIRGSIEVTLADRPSDRIILKPNEKLILKSTTFKRHTINRNLVAQTPDTAKTSYALTNLTYLKSNDTTVVETSWVNNRLIFKDEDFSEIANKMERWYGIKINFKNTDAKDYHFTGVFEKENILQALKALQMIEPFSYKYKNETVYIY